MAQVTWLASELPGLFSKYYGAPGKRPCARSPALSTVPGIPSCFREYGLLRLTMRMTRQLDIQINSVGGFAESSSRPVRKLRPESHCSSATKHLANENILFLADDRMVA